MGGFDCSLFVQTVFRQAGIYIPRDTPSYSSSSDSIWLDSFSDLLPGDLILYDSLGVGHTTHVAIYLGDGQVCHVNTVAGQIRIQDYRLGGGYYPITGYLRYR